MPALAAVECVDNGSLLEAMRERVLPRGANNIRFFADFAVERLAEPPRTLPGGERNRVRHDPAGVVAVSTPWNAPFMLATWRVGPGARRRQHGRAEAARVGAADVLDARRPRRARGAASRACSTSSTAAARSAGAPLTGHPGVDRVAFTGSPATARTVYRDAAAQLTPVSFELGGKSPFLVFADCDLDAAAATAAYQYDNAGQVCLAGTRLLVEAAVLEPFLERLRARVAEIVVGDPRLAATRPTAR